MNLCDPGRHDGAASVRAAPLAALALTLATSAWIASAAAPAGPCIKIFGAGLAVTLVIMSIGGWLASGRGELGANAVSGSPSGRSQSSWPLPFCSTRHDRYRSTSCTTQRWRVLLFGVTAFGTMHQSAEFILLGLSNQAARACRTTWEWYGAHPRSDRAGVIWMTLRARKNPRATRLLSLASALRQYCATLARGVSSRVPT